MSIGQYPTGPYGDKAFQFADPPIVRRVKPRDAAVINTFLTSDDGTVQIAIDALIDCDFDRQQPIKVIGVDSVLFRDPKSSTTEGDIRHTLNADAHAFWVGRAQHYADNLGQWEVDHIRDKVRQKVALVGN